jgi:hypothetical protein
VSPSRCLRALVPWALALGIAWITPAPADALTVTGHVQKGEERTPAPGISVQLHIVKGDQELPGKTAVSGKDGSFQFTGLASDPDLSYFLATEYEGAFYTEGPLETEGKSETTRDLLIYDVGRDIQSVRVTNQHVVVERGPDRLRITEILVFQNSGKTAYLGTGMNHAENVGIRLGLPASVNHFEPGIGGDAPTIQVHGRDLASFRPIPPGTHPFSFTYEVPLSGRMDLSHRLYFPTDRVVVLISDPKLRLDSKSLRDMGPTEQGGRKFELYQGAGFPIGAEVPMRIRGAGFWSNPKIYPWVAAPFLIVAVLIIAARRGRTVKGSGAPRAASPTPTPGTQTEEDLAAVYLYLVDALDKGLERGEFGKESHDLVRGNLKRRLEAILSDQPRAGAR